MRLERALNRDVVSLLFFWAPAGIVAVLLASPTNVTSAQALMASLSMIFGVWIFWSHGNAWVTAAGVYSLCTGVFVGYAGWWWLLEMGDRLPPHLFTATAVGYFTNVSMYALFWSSLRTRYPSKPRLNEGGHRTTWALNLGLGLTIASIVGSRVTPWPYLAEITFVGIILFATGLLMRPSAERIGAWRVVLVAAALLMYMLTVFDGYGRLTVAALGLAVAVLLSSRFRTRIVKAGILVGAPPMVIALGQIRAEETMARFGIASMGSTGPGSMVSPLETFARLLSPDLHFENANGSTFWSTIVVFVPRSIWPSKPIGLGAELTRLLEPTLIDSGHSMAALAVGEWYFNWGWLGLVAMVIGIGVAVRLLDIMAIRILGQDATGHRTIFGVAAIATAIGGLGDLVWVGSFTYGSRTGLRLSLLLMILLASVWCLPNTDRHGSLARRTVRRRHAEETEPTHNI